MLYMNEKLLSKQQSSAFPRFFLNSSINKKKFKWFSLLAALFVIIAVTLTIFVLGAEQNAYAASEEILLLQPAKTVEVGKGDTLWAIASRHVHKGQKIHDYLYELKKVNGLKSSILQEGQLIKLP